MSTGNQGLFNRPGYNNAVVGLSGPTSAYVANGSGPAGIAIVSDGVSLTDIATNSGSVQQMNIEMVQEVKATNSSYGARICERTGAHQLLDARQAAPRITARAIWWPAMPF